MENYDRNGAGDGQRAVSRRRYLGGVAAVAAAATAGCSGILGGGGGPEGAVREFYTALDNGNADKMNSLIHPDGEGSEISDQQAEEMSQIGIEIENTEVVEEDGDTAIVEVEATMSMMGQEQTQTSQVELRKHNGDWKIYGGV